MNRKTDGPLDLARAFAAIEHLQLVNPRTRPGGILEQGTAQVLRELLDRAADAGADVCRRAADFADEMSRNREWTGEPREGEIARRALAEAARQLKRCAALLRGDAEPADEFERDMLRRARGEPAKKKRKPRSWTDRLRRRMKAGRKAGGL